MQTFNDKTISFDIMRKLFAFLPYVVNPLIKALKGTRTNLNQMNPTLKYPLYIAF